MLDCQGKPVPKTLGGNRGKPGTGKPGGNRGQTGRFLISFPGGGTTSFYEQDGLGSVTSLSSSAGALANTYTYDSFGKVTTSGTQPTQAALILTYNHGTGTYEVDQMLQPDQQMWIDVGQLIRSQAPDKNGNVLPAALVIGSYEVLQSPRHAGVQQTKTRPRTAKISPKTPKLDR